MEIKTFVSLDYKSLVLLAPVMMLVLNIALEVVRNRRR